MNHKEKDHSINSRIIPLVAGLCFVFLLSSTPAGAGPTTGELQQQIDELTAHVNRLLTLIEEPNDKSYTAGIAAVSEIEDCEVDEYGMDCEETTVILIDVLEGQEVNIEAILKGPPIEAMTLSIVKLPRDNPLSSRDYQVDVEIVKGEDTNNISVSPDEPLYTLRDDPCYYGDFKLKCELISDWRIKILIPRRVDANSVRQIRTEAVGAIIQAHIEPYPESATETELKVHMANYGDLKSDYMVTATGFGPSIEPVVAESVTLEPYEEPTLTLPIRTVDTFAGQGPCLVILKSTTGRIYDSTTVDFPSPLPDGPAPRYIPDFDGDGDVDLVDFGHFGNYWLEQAG